MRRQVFLWGFSSAVCLLAGGRRASTEGRPGGITLSRGATLSLDGIEHDDIQTIDEARVLAALRGLDEGRFEPEACADQPS